MLTDQYGRGLVAFPGSFDDPTNEGAVRAHLAAGELVKLPFPDGQYLTELNGTSTATLQSSGVYVPGNSDGSATALYITTQDAIAHNGGARVSFVFYGTRFGLRGLTNQGISSNPPLDVQIDGVSYEIRHKSDGFFAANTWTGGEWIWMCPDTLKDHKHICRVTVPGAMVSGQTFGVYLTGMVVERRPGNGDPIYPRRASAFNSGTLTTSNTNLYAGLTA